MPYHGPSESQSIAEAAAPPPLYRTVRDALAWFREAWQAPIPERLHRSAAHVDDSDALGGPAMTERFRAYLMEAPRDPLRRALLDMAYGDFHERLGARYLFVLACRDFDPQSAGAAMGLYRGYVPWYTEKAIDRLRERMVGVDRARKLSRTCAEPGCTARTDRLYCPTHRREAA